MLKQRKRSWRDQVFDILEDKYQVATSVAIKWAKSDDGLLDDLHGYGSTPEYAAKSLFEQNASASDS